MTFSLERSSGSAAEFHARHLPDPLSPTLWVLDVDRPAVVLGSTQPDAIVDHARAEAAGYQVVRRRSGGGAVLLEPGGALWVDVLLPRSDPRWHDDVGRAAHWVGDAWAAALAAVGVAGAEVHRAGLEGNHWSGLVCFAGRGPGEVFVGGQKVVGISQRRVRHGARFQCAIYREWAPQRLVGLLDLPEAERERAAAELREVALGIGPALDDLTPALAAALSH